MLVATLRSKYRSNGVCIFIVSRKRSSMSSRCSILSASGLNI